MLESDRKAPGSFRSGQLRTTDLEAGSVDLHSVGQQATGLGQPLVPAVLCLMGEN